MASSPFSLPYQAQPSNAYPPALPPRPSLHHEPAWSPVPAPASTFQPTQQSAHPIYRKYGHMMQDQNTTQPWQQPIPPVSPPAYSYTNTPQPQPSNRPDYFQHAFTTTASGRSPQISPFAPFTPDPKDDNKPLSSFANNNDTPVSPPVPDVSPLVSRQCSIASQYARAGWQSRHERADTVSSVSSMATVTTASGADGGGGSKAEMSASASALLGFGGGFGGPGGWEYYAPLGDGDGEESEGEAVDEGRKGEDKEDEGRVSPEVAEVAAVELPSEDVGVGEGGRKEDDVGEGPWKSEEGHDGIFELPAAESWGEATIRPADSAEDKGGEQADLPKPSSRYNRIPRPQDLIPDLGPWYASSLERYVAMLKAEAYAMSDEQRVAAFTDFVAAESQLRGVPYSSQPVKPQMTLEIPPQTADGVDIEYSPGGRPIFRSNSSDLVAAVKEDQPLYKPFRQDTSDGPETAINSATTPKFPYKPYTPGTSTAETSRSNSFPTKSPPHEHAETFFPAPLTLRPKKDTATASNSAPPSPSKSQVAPPLVAAAEEAASPPVEPSTSATSTPPETLMPAPLAPSPLAVFPSARPTGLPRLKALVLTATTPSPSSPQDLALIRTTLTTALPPLPPTRAHIASLHAHPSPAFSAAAAAKALHAALAATRTSTQTENDMAFESHELSYADLLDRDAALRADEEQKVGAEAGAVGAAGAKRYAEWEAGAWAGVYGRVREEVARGVEGLRVVEGVGEGVVGALRPRPGSGGGIVKINAGTGEMIVVEGLTRAGGDGGGGGVVDNLTALSTATAALLALHRGIAARHALLATAVAARDAEYAAAQVAALEFVVAFEELDDPVGTGSTPPPNKATTKKKDAGGEGEKGPKRKLAALRRHFAEARRAAGRRAAGEEEARARQTWERVRGWMECGVGVVAGMVGEVGEAVGEVEQQGVGEGKEEVRKLLTRAEEVVVGLVGKATELVRAFWEAEVLLNEAEFGVGVEEAKTAAGGEQERMRTLSSERAREDGVLREEMSARVGGLEKELERVRRKLGLELE